MKSPDDEISYSFPYFTPKRFLFRFPETGEVVFFNARRFLLYALMEGRTVTGFVEIPPKE